MRNRRNTFPGRPCFAGGAQSRRAYTLRHRGPDAQKIWIVPHGQVALGHARLSIIDLESGDQPIANENSTAWIVANGEFYDYERVQKELDLGEHRLRTRSDSEIALHLYEDLGTQSVHGLRGEFAFVIWDDRTRKLIAVRDRFGVKPLFYAVHNGALYVASEMKALFAAGVPARWDAEALHCSAFRPPGRTLFRAVLDDASKVRLRADVPVGCYLSGGIDSCAVLGLAAQQRSDPIRAFTLRFDHADYDEGAVAAEMARKAGAEWVRIPITQGSLADNFADAIYYRETFCVNAHFVAKFLLSRAVHDAGFKVVLTGEGSDEMLAGYAHFREDMLLYDSAGQDPEEVARLVGASIWSNLVVAFAMAPTGRSEGG